MRIELQRSEVGRLINQVTKAVESRTTIPILGHVRLVVASGTLTATATDLDIEVSGSIPAIGDDMAFCVDAKLLAGIVGKIAGDTITVELADNRVTIKAGRSRFTLDTLPVDDFPSMQAGTFDADLTLDLAALVAPVQFAISTEETRYYLNGVFLHNKDGQLVAAATDGHRLARHIGPDAPELAGIILPRKLVGLLPKGEVRFEASQTKVRITAPDGVVFIGKLIDGTFPDYDRVIPTGNDRVATFAAADMIAAANRVAVVSSERERGLRLAITDGEIGLSIRGEGEAEDVVACSFASEDSEPLTVGFNAAYLAELVGMFGGGDVKMALADGMSPAVFTGATDGLLCVLMPRRV